MPISPGARRAIRRCCHLVPALWKRSRRRALSAVAVVCAIAAVMYGAVPAMPAQAQTVPSGGPFDLNISQSQDLVVSERIPDVAPADLRDFYNTFWPKSLGLPAGAPVSDEWRAIWQKYWQQYSNNQSRGVDFPEPPSLSGVSLSVGAASPNGSNVTVTVPSANFTNISSAEWPTYKRNLMGAFGGFFAGGVAFYLSKKAIFRMNVPYLMTADTGEPKLRALGEVACAAAASLASGLVSDVMVQALTGAPWSPDVWEAIGGHAMTSVTLNSTVIYLIPVLIFIAKWLIIGIAKGVSWFATGILSLIGAYIAPYLAAGYVNFTNAVARLFGRGEQRVGNYMQYPWPDLELGELQVNEEGYIVDAQGPAARARPATGVAHTHAAGAAQPPLNCMDTNGASGVASAGQAVAINTCNASPVSPSQAWGVWSNGMITNFGLCLDTTSSHLVDLQPCDGSSSQKWAEVGSTVVNKFTQYCLDDPNGNTSPGTQLGISPCNGSQEQKWQLPAAKPCDIYGASATSCVAAYSMTRAMYAAYNGPLYQVKRASDGAAADIGLLSPGGDVDAAGQDSFCAGTTCTITEIYDQSLLGNNLTIEGPGQNGGQDRGAIASALPVKLGNHKAYGLDIEQGVGYRVNNTLGVATAGEPEGMYMVASGTHVNSGCCFDFGNAEQSNIDTGAGHMDAVSLSTRCHATPCGGSGPWVQADLENGLWSGNGPNPGNKGNSTSFVTAMLKNNGQDNFAVKGGDSTSGGLSTWYDGPLPAGYAPMHQEGSVVLGTGGDDSNTGVGSWFEGVMTAGYPSDAADSAVQSNTVAAGYSGSTNPSPPGTTSAEATPAGQAVLHDGYTSVFTVNASDGHLQESFLPHIGDRWTTQDLSQAARTPQVMPGTKPVALTHCGYTGVYTVDASNGDLQATYLPGIGQKWQTQDLSQKYGAPPTDQTPGAVEHTNGAPGATPGCGYTSLYTRDRNGDLQDTYLPNTGFPGDPWHTQDLSSMPAPHTPQIQPGTSPVAITHCGYTSVYTVDAANHHLQTTYLPKLGGQWATEDLSRDYGTPSTDSTPTAVEHTAGAPGATQNCGYTSVFTVNEGSRDLEESYLPKLGGPWHHQDLSSMPSSHTPPVAPGTHPVALVHTDYTSVYTIDQGTDQLQTTYLPAIGQKWNTENLSHDYKTPPTDQSPTPLLHLDPSGNLDWTSVYTVNQFNNHLQTTYLPKLGGPWTTEDLTFDYHTPPVYVPQAAQPSWSVAQSGYTSVFTVNRPIPSNSRYGHLQWSYLPQMGAAWHQDDLGINARTPEVADGTQPVALAQPGGTTRVFTLDKIKGCTCGALQVTTQPVGPGFAWNTQNLTQGSPHTPPAALTLTSASAVFHDGYVGVYTAAAANGDLWATYLPGPGGWQTQNLSARYHIPPVKAGTSPVAVFHDGFVGVFTVDTNGDLQDSYLPVLGGPWHTLDLTQGSPHVPATSTTPTVIFRDGYVGVFTVDGLGKTADGDLQDTYLPAIGDSWSTQDLTRNYHLPEAEQGVRPTAVYHTGYTSVFFLSVLNGGTATHLEDAFLPAIGTAWHWQDMTTDYNVPRTFTPSSALAHYASDGGLTWTSLYTTNGDTSHCDLQETNLPRIGDKWTTQDLSAKFSLGGTC